ncbi:MAG: HDOD domain-containing protein [Candidatus Marinimicrobia bacterium]|nr:HDOD domain-containing protein [Candidatus Neomarinimicrobiota bacterium]
MSRRDQIIDQLGSIPAMPVVVDKLRQLLADPDVDFRELADVLKYDPGMTANLLRLANSAYFGFRTQADNIRQCVSRLGTKRMGELVMTAAVGPVMQGQIKGYDLPAGELWKHSIAVAIGTEQLAGLLGLQIPEDAFTAGLLHDIGKIIMGTFIEVDTGPILELVEEQGVTFDEAERQVLGIDHAEIGALLFEKWNFPSAIINTARWHHAPQNFGAESLVLNLVHIADSVSMMSGIGTGQDGLAYRISDKILEKLPINNQIIEACAFETMIKVNELSDLYRIA